MGKAIDLTGTKIGMLSIIERRTENSGTYYLCKCDCGNEKWIKSNYIIKKNKISSCGCVKNYKFTDISGKRFGRLVAIKRVGTYYSSTLWECKCDCGNIVNIPLQHLNNGATRSCGCLKSDKLKNKNNFEEYQLDGTNVAYLKSKRLSKANKSGVRGVCKKKNGKWLAQITFKRKNYNLGTYESFEEAVKARKEGEEKLYNEFLRNLKE